MLVYRSWPKVPRELCTKTSLRRQRLRLPPDAQPVAAITDRWGTHPLYQRADAMPIPYKRPPKDYPALFAARYATTRAAYQDTCKALFSLNRYAKHPDCSADLRWLIYQLKDRWTARLWHEGFCIGAVKVYTPRRYLACDYGPVGGHPFWGLRYEVDGQQFFWHQPEHCARWAQALGQEAPHEVIVQEKPVRLARGRIREALALLRWVLGPEPVPAPPPPPPLRDFWTSGWSLEGVRR